MNIYLSKKSLFSLLFYLSFYLRSEIIEIKNFNEILLHASPQAIVLVDIDNTLLEPCNTEQIGSDQWISHLLRTSQDAEEVIAHYCSTMLSCSLQLIEHDAPKILNKLQEDHLVLGFTMRSIVLAPSTTQYLKQYSIRFNAQLSDAGFMIENKFPAMLYDNILFCQGKKNGTTLFTVLDTYNINPAKIIMIDDKRSYLESIKESCKNRGIEFIGLRYSYLDEKVTNYEKIQHS